MSYFCYGCMLNKEQRPICEHCGFSELTNNPRWALPIGMPLKNRYLVGKANYYSDLRDHSVTYIGMDKVRKRRVIIEEYYPYWCSRKGEFGEVSMHPCDVGQFCEGWKAFVQKGDPLTRLYELPGLEQIYDVFEQNGTCYIVRQCHKGLTLMDHVRPHGKLGPEETLSIVRKTAEILTALHQLELVHRNLRPETIWLRPDGRVKLAEMGLTEETLKELFPDRSRDRDEDRPEDTHGFHAKERKEPVWPGGACGPWTDVYSLCAVAWYCLTGEEPPMWHGGQEGQLELDWAGIPGLTERQRRALEKGMALSWEDRWQSVPEFIEALGEDCEVTLRPTASDLEAGFAGE